jgi:hypothetical protein
MVLLQKAFLVEGLLLNVERDGKLTLRFAPLLLAEKILESALDGIGPFKACDGCGTFLEVFAFGFSFFRSSTATRAPAIFSASSIKPMECLLPID